MGEVDLRRRHWVDTVVSTLVLGSSVVPPGRKRTRGLEDLVSVGGRDQGAVALFSRRNQWLRAIAATSRLNHMHPRWLQDPSHRQRAHQGSYHPQFPVAKESKDDWLTNHPTPPWQTVTSCYCSVSTDRNHLKVIRASGVAALTSWGPNRNAQRDLDGWTQDAPSVPLRISIFDRSSIRCWLLAAVAYPNGVDTDERPTA